MKKFSEWHWIVKISGPVSYSLFAVSVIAYFVFFRGDSRDLISLTWGCISLGIVILGYAVMLTARFQLKSKFFIRAKDAEYITTGLYKYFRHPIYMSSSFSGLGILIFFLALDIGALLKNIDIYNEGMINIVAIVFFIAYITNQYRRAEREEKVLRRKYRESYKKYKEKTIC